MYNTYRITHVERNSYIYSDFYNTYLRTPEDIIIIENIRAGKNRGCSTANKLRLFLYK